MLRRIGASRSSQQEVVVFAVAVFLVVWLLVWFSSAVQSANGQTVAGATARTPTSISTATPTVTPTLTPTSTATSTATPTCPPSWGIVYSPDPSSSTNYLFGVGATSSNDVWAVGSYHYGSGSFGIGTLTLHWGGYQWAWISSPSPGISDGFSDVEAVSPNDVWAVGRWADATVDHTLIKHWNGTQWSVVSSPDVTTRTNWLYDVSPVSPTDVWAVGYYCCGAGGAGTLAEHWDGVQWSIASSPNPSTNNNYFNAVAAISSGDLWAVGYSGGAIWQTLTEHYSITDACLTPSATPTSSLTLTNTRTPTYTRTPTSTTTSTPTLTPTSTSTSTPTFTLTSTETSTSTSTPTITPTVIITLVGHVYWEARPTQPNQLQQLHITLTLKLGTSEWDYPTQLTDQYGFFTVTLGNLAPGMYNWRVDDTTSGQHSPNYLANAGVVALGGGSVVNVEMGLMRAGDANNDNLINSIDFNILKGSFGFACGQPAYDNRADFTGDCAVSVADFNPLRSNFGHGGAPPIGAGGR